MINWFFLPFFFFFSSFLSCFLNYRFTRIGYVLGGRRGVEGGGEEEEEARRRRRRGGGGGEEEEEASRETRSYKILILYLVLFEAATRDQKQKEHS